MDEAHFKTRTFNVALRVIRLVKALPNDRICRVIGHKILRSATSVGANYRAACRSRSKSEMIAKLGIVDEEADETLYWMELLIRSQYVSKSRLHDLIAEVDEIIAITVASIKTLRIEQ